MGAWGFGEARMAGSMKQAFREAQDEARVYHGIDPYNGTISTVASATLVKLPSRMDAETFQALVWAYEGCDEDGKPDLDMLSPKIKGRHSRMTPEQRDYVRRVALHIIKWEECVAVKLAYREAAEWKKDHGLVGKRGNVYFFFGLAAC